MIAGDDIIGDARVRSVALSNGGGLVFQLAARPPPHSS
jgi:hypothetical protein